MGKSDFVWGSAMLTDFIGWMVERHEIWKRRQLGQEWPWTDDPVLKEFKFTNVFRELDKGTLALRGMIPDDACPKDIVFNTIWYRSFNRFEHATDIGFHRTHHFHSLCKKLLAKDLSGQRMFTSAHMTHGQAGQRKVFSVLDTLSDVVVNIKSLTDGLMSAESLEDAFKKLRSYKFRGIGPFIAYEIISDLRWSICRETTDRCSWANLGPGCKRGMKRLGRQHDIESLRRIRAEVMLHEAFAPLRVHADGVWPPFEMREIEHSLCEFDKYCRGGGKEKYRR